MESEMIVLKGKTVGDLFDFLYRAVILGEISESLSAHLRAGVKKIFLATCPPTEFWRDVPLDSVNLAERIETLRKNNRGECSEETIYVYKKRYERSLRLYLDWLSRQPGQCQSEPEPSESHPQFKKQPKHQLDSASPEHESLENILRAASLSAKASLSALLASDKFLDNYHLIASSSGSKISYLVLPKNLSSAELAQTLREISPLLAISSDTPREKGKTPP